MPAARLTALVVLLLAALGVGRAGAQEPSRVLFRLFLTDGRVLSSFGEWARLGERVVFSLPTSGGDEPRGLELVSIASDRVDWSRTNQYADSVRAASYAVSRGDADFAVFSAEVAKALNDVALVSDPGVRLVTAERARQSLAEWPGSHYGYRVDEVREMLGVLDGIIAELRAAVGQTRFNLALTAPLAAAPDPPLPPPSDAEVVEQLATAASLVETPGERITLLQKVVDLLDRAVGSISPAWAARIRRAVVGDLETEQAVSRAYVKLRDETLADAARAAAKAELTAFEPLRERVRRDDARLGHRQPGDVVSLLATIDAQQASAEELKKARDQYKKRAPAFRSYRRAMRGPFGSFDKAKAALIQVRAMSGPSTEAIGKVTEDMARRARALAKVEPPEELVSGHALVLSAWELAENALTMRLRAVAANDMDLARQASSAAAGALMLYDRGRADLTSAMAEPGAK